MIKFARVEAEVLLGVRREGPVLSCLWQAKRARNYLSTKEGQNLEKVPEKSQSWDVFRNISSSLKWSQESTPGSKEKKSLTQDEKSTETLLPEPIDDKIRVPSTVVKSGVAKKPDAKNGADSKPEVFKLHPLSSTGDSANDDPERVLSKLLEASSIISKVAQLNILNEHLARDNSFLTNKQKTTLVGQLMASKDKLNSKKRYQEAVKCTFNLIGLPPKPKGAGIKILCIDGGGTRGLAPLEMLAVLEKKCIEKKIIQPNKIQHSSSASSSSTDSSSLAFLSQFDLICGVSTGSIVAFMTAVAGLSFDTSISMYRKMASEIFQRSSFMSVGSTLTGNSWYDTEKWLRHLQSYEKSFDPVYMASKEPNTPLICAVSAITNRQILRPYVFRSYGFRSTSRSRYLGGAAIENWEVLRATTAAPFYFDPFAYEDMILQDGGILVNNPTALAIHEARALWPDEELQLVLSMGTGLQNSIPKEDLTRPASKQQQQKQKAKAVRTEYLKTFNHFIDSVTNTEVVHTTLKDLLPRGTYFRFNPRLNDNFVLDEFRAEKLDDLRQQTLKYMDGQQDRVDRFAACFAKQRSTKSKLRDMWKQRLDHIFPN